MIRLQPTRVVHLDSGGVWLIFEGADRFADIEVREDGTATATARSSTSSDSWTVDKDCDMAETLRRIARFMLGGD